MYARVEKPKENSFSTKRQESRAVANSVVQNKGDVKQGFGIVDNRHEIISQGRLLQRIQEQGVECISCEAPIQRIEIANIASGTDPSTLMHSIGEDENVINIDTGHMVISDAIIHANHPLVWKAIAKEFVRLNLNTSYPKAVKLAPVGEKVEWLAGTMVKDPLAGAARLKQVLSVKAGMKGAYEIYHLLPDPLKYEIAMKLQSLDDFKLGDLGTFAEQSLKKGGTDIVHIINALGFDPIGDPAQALHLATGIKPGGILFITAEASGQSVASLIPKKLIWTDEALKLIGTFLLGPGIEKLTTLPLGEFFDLVDSTVSGKAEALKSDPHTTTLDTRHTIASGASTSMEDNIPTVKLILKRNTKPVA